MARRQKYIFAEEPRRGRGFLIGSAVTLFLLLAVLFVWNFALNHSVVLTKEYVTISNLPTNLENWVVLHLSDLGGATIGEQQSAISKAVGSKSVSCVVLSGGMVGKDGDVKPLLQLLEALPKGAPVLLLPGGSDPSPYAASGSSYSVYAPWAEALISRGVILLDQPVSFTRGKDVIWFIPEYLYSLNLDSSRAAWQNQVDLLTAQVEPLTPDQAAQLRLAQFQVDRLQRIADSIASIGEKDVQIAVTHYPLTRDYVAASRAAAPAKAVFSLNNTDLVLAGGYCAGQWRLPWGGALYAPDLGFFPEDHLLQGMSYLGGVWQNITPGLGVSPDSPLLPFRLFNSPAITQITLTASVR